jgi:hypothetical protein
MNKLNEQEEHELYLAMKDLPDFLSYPIPSKWFKKYNIPPIEAGSTKEFIESGYTVKCMFAPKDLSPIIINEPQRDLSGNIKLVKLIEEEPIEVKVISRPYDPNNTLSVLENVNESENESEDVSNTNDQCAETNEAPLVPEVQEKTLQH